MFARAGDTIFTAPPNFRSWNTEYMQQVFFDGFDGTSLDQNIWTVELCRGRGYKENNEGEPDNIEVSNGTLKLFSKYNPGNIDKNCWDSSHFVSDYTSAEIWTQNYPYRYKYGSFEAKCFMPRGDHFYYAYWLWGPGGNGFPFDGFTSEVDISEGVEWNDGTHHKMKATFHLWPQDGGGEIELPEDVSKSYGTEYEGDWHIYKMIWNPYEIIFYIDSNEVWRRTRFHTNKDLEKNDVSMNEIETGITYNDRNWFPNDEMATVFQMHIQKGVLPWELPAAMEVDYVEVKQFFLTPEIDCPDFICSTQTITLDADPNAENVRWDLTPASLFETASGTGGSALIKAANGARGEGNITFSFEMQSGETYSIGKSFWLGKPTNEAIDISLPNHDIDDDKICIGKSTEIVAQHSMEFEAGVTNYNWEFNLWNRYIDSIYSSDPNVEGRAISLTLDEFAEMQEVVKVNAENVCGATDFATLTLNPVDCSEIYLTVSPNPATNGTTIAIEFTSGKEMDANEKWSLEIFDTKQSLVLKKTVNGGSSIIRTNNWSSGIYFIRTVYGETVFKAKLIVN